MKNSVVLLLLQQKQLFSRSAGSCLGKCLCSCSTAPPAEPASRHRSSLASFFLRGLQNPNPAPGLRSPPRICLTSGSFPGEVASLGSRRMFPRSFRGSSARHGTRAAASARARGAGARAALPGSPRGSPRSGRGGPRAAPLPQPRSSTGGPAARPEPEPGRRGGRPRERSGAAATPGGGGGEGGRTAAAAGGPRSAGAGRALRAGGCARLAGPRPRVFCGAGLCRVSLPFLAPVALNLAFYPLESCKSLGKALIWHIGVIPSGTDFKIFMPGSGPCCVLH